MSKPAAEIEKLRDEIRHHDDLYYSQAKPEISDQQYDALMRKLLDLEVAHPEWATPDSPTQRVGGKPIDAFKSVKHAVRMMSIDNTYDESEVRDFDDRIKRLLGGEKFSYTCEPKIDGLSMSVRYEKGIMVLAATRGNGEAGDDVTANARTIRSLPLQLKTHGLRPMGTHDSKIPGILEVRGETFISRKQFAAINAQQEEAGEEAYVNPRNTASGTLKLLDSKTVAARRLEFIPHGLGEFAGLEPETFAETYALLKQLGFQTNPHFKPAANIDEVLEYIHAFTKTRTALPYDTDGVVVKVDRLDQRAALGAHAKSPRWCIAYKYQPEQAETELARVVFQVGKTGTITPVGEFEPSVFISGTNVYRASLHNFDEIARKDIRLHDRVLVEKAGEVIPYVVGIVEAKRPAKARIIHRPGECPSCGSKDLEDDGPRVLCRNPNCPAQLAERMRYFAGRNQMDIENLGEKIIEQLLEKKRATSLPDLYRLAADDVVDLDRMAEKSAENLINGIADSKKRPLSRLIAGLGIHHVGNRTAQLVCAQFPSIDELRAATLAELLSVEGMGGGVLDEFAALKEKYASCAHLTLEQVFGVEPINAATQTAIAVASSDTGRNKTPQEAIDAIRAKGVAARSLYDFLHSKSGQSTLDEFVDLGVNMTEPQIARTGPQLLAGKTIVVTGTLARFSRTQIKNKIEALGGKAGESVSKATAFVIAGEEAGSKLDKAKKLGVEVITEDEFLKRVGE